MNWDEGYREITKILPHRYPFLFIDKIVEHVVGPNKDNRIGGRCVAIKNVTNTEPHLQGHFPRMPIMPGVLLLEAMAQTGGIACARPGDPQMDILIVSVKEARFRKTVVPGDSVRLQSEVVKDRGKMVSLKCEAFVDNQLVAETEFMAQITPSILTGKP